MNITELKNKSESVSEFIENNEKVILDFYAEWCGPCGTLGKNFASIMDSEANGFTLLKVDVDEFDDIAEEYGVTHLPCVFVFVNGKRVDKFTGAKSRAELITLLANN